MKLIVKCNTRNVNEVWLSADFVVIMLLLSVFLSLSLFSDL